MASKVHRVRYYNPKPQPINCVSYNKSNKIIAVARSDASIEVWDLHHAPYLMKFIPGVKNGSVEALAWVHDRLLSTGLGGALIEWDLNQLCVKTTTLLTGYTAWCLDVNSLNTLIAVGTEQGYINLFNVEDNGIIYSKLFDKQEGRILCCKFDSTGNVLVTGSINTIRIWNVETGHATNRISVSRKGKDTIVWCLAVLSDNVIVSGDSHGKLTFWDGTMGDQIETYTTHKRDILAMTVSDDESSIYCSGIDPVIMNFIKVKGKSAETQWVKNVQRNIHEHDVRALVINEDRLVSVGTDGYLTLSSYPPKWVMRIPFMIPTPNCAVCPEKKLLLLRYSNHLEVWKLGSYMKNEKGYPVLSNFTPKQNINQIDNSKQLEQDSANELNVFNQAIKNNQSETLKLLDNPLKLVLIQTKGNKQIRSCEMSPSGEFILYSTDTDNRILKLDTDEDQTNTSLSKVIITGLSKPFDRAAFIDDSRTLLVYCAGTIYVLQVDPEAGATVVQSIPTDKYLKTTSILHFCVSKPTSSGSTYLVVADTQGAIAVWIQKTKKFEHRATLPKYHCIPSALTVDSLRENLIVVYVDQRIVEYNLVNKKLSEWARTSLPEDWSRRTAAVVCVTAHPVRNALVLHDATSLWILDKGQDNYGEPDAKRRPSSSNINIKLKVIPIKYLTGFHWIGDDEAVAVEILPENILMQLPSPMYFKKRVDL